MITDAQLKQWASTQRSFYRKGDLEVRRVKQLEQVPGWVWEFPDVGSKNKAMLLELAAKDEKPTSFDPLYGPLTQFTNKNRKSYDSEFDKQIRELVPHWFVKAKDLVPDKKMELLVLAQQTSIRPKSGTRMGIFLQECIRVNRSSRYGEFDQEFFNQLKSIRPEWVDKVSHKKQALLDMARRKEERPEQRKHPLGKPLCRYTNPKFNTYDAKFDKQIRDLAPHWFVTADCYKKELLDWASKPESGKPIVGKHPLATRLHSYMCKVHPNYDADFDKQIRQLRPEWFVDPTLSVKQELLAMGSAGRKRPTQRESKIGSALSRYTNPTSQSYDAEFDKKIRALRPDWFDRYGRKAA